MSHLRSLRNQLGLTQVEMAELVNLSQPTISAVECRRSRLTWGSAEQIAHAVAPLLNLDEMALTVELVRSTAKLVPTTPDESCTPLDARVA